MSTFRELTYLVLDELKQSSDDKYYTVDHILFILSKYRAFLLKQKYADIKKLIPEVNYQAIKLTLQAVPAISGEPSEGDEYMRGIEKLPCLMRIGNTTIADTSLDYFKGDIAYVTRDRFRYVGNNKYMNNIVYAAVAPDDYLYFKSVNPEYMNIQTVMVTAIFQDAREASELSIKTSDQCDLMDREFPLESPLIPIMIELTVKELSGALYRPKDDINNSADDTVNSIPNNK